MHAQNAPRRFGASLATLRLRGGRWRRRTNNPVVSIQAAAVEGELMALAVVGGRRERWYFRRESGVGGETQ